MEPPPTGLGDDYNIGDSVVAGTQPTTEGLILNKRIREDGKIELTLLVAPFHKKGYPWTKATICIKEAAKLSKRPANTCMFSIPNVHKWREEAKQARACPVWMLSTLEEINMKIGTEEKENEDELQQSASSSLSRRGSITPANTIDIANTSELEQRLTDVLRLSKTKGQKKHKNFSTIPSSSDSEPSQKHTRNSKRKHKKRHSSSSSSSTDSSSSSSDELSDRGEVREKGKTGMFSCPFAPADSRGFKDVKLLVRGQATSRKHIRTALHNLYAEHYSMATFTNYVISAANTATMKPFPSDVAWLALHARYLDGILLNSISGAWSLWNEAWLDDIMQAFLELLVRVSATKEYPHCLDDKVRKWMKKRRVGVNPRYGPVTALMHQAKITENGLQLFQQRTTTKDAVKWTKKTTLSPTGGESKTK